MRVALDTSAYSAAARGHRALREAIEQAEEVWMASIAIGELLYGFRRGGLKAENRRKFEAFLSSPCVAVASIDGTTAEHYAAIKSALRESGAPIPSNDLWIAASAMQHGLKLLTTDRHFNRVGQILVECFEVE